MNSSETFKDNQNEKIPVDDYFDGIEHSSFQKRNSGFKLPKFIGMPLFITGAGVVILIIFISILFHKTDETTEVGEQEEMASRIRKIEDRLTDMEKFEQKLVELEKEGKKIGLLQSRLDHIEANMAARLDRLSAKSEPSVLTHSAESASTGDTQKTGSKTVGKYHQVVPGETLYSIGRKYNMSLQDLLRLNPSLSKNSGIQPGQKITVSASRSGKIQ